MSATGSLKSIAEKVLSRNAAVRHDATRDVKERCIEAFLDASVATPRRTMSSPSAPVALRKSICDCRRLPSGEPVHRPDCLAVAAMRKQPVAVWLQESEPDLVGDAVRELLKPGEYVDERGRIRRVQ